MINHILDFQTYLTHISYISKHSAYKYKHYISSFLIQYNTFDSLFHLLNFCFICSDSLAFLFSFILPRCWLLLLLIVFNVEMISSIIPVLAIAELLTALSQTGMSLGRDKVMASGPSIIEPSPPAWKPPILIP